MKNMRLFNVCEAICKTIREKLREFVFVSATDIKTPHVCSLYPVQA